MTTHYLHLLTNHLPIVGALLSLPLLAIAAGRPADRTWLHAGTLLLVIAAIGGGAAFWSGEGAEEVVEELGVSHDAIHEHEEAGEVAAVVLGLSAAAAVGVTVYGRGRALSLGLLAIPLLGAMVSAGLMARSGQSGGALRRPELNDPPAAKPAEVDDD